MLLATLRRKIGAELFTAYAVVNTDGERLEASYTTPDTAIKHAAFLLNPD
jgi:hypothetical protein